jgi:hypothetical protein
MKEKSLASGAPRPRARVGWCQLRRSVLSKLETARFWKHITGMYLAPRTPFGVRFSMSRSQGWLASLAHPWLQFLHASGVQNAARRAAWRVAPVERSDTRGFVSTLSDAPWQVRG